MRKVFPMVVLLAPVLLLGCADEAETVVVQPPAQQGSTVVLPERAGPSTVVVPERRKEPTVIVPSEDGVKVCPEGATC